MHHLAVHVRRLAVILASLALTTKAAEYRYASNLALELPDGGGLGTFSQQQVSGIDGTITRVTLTLDVSGNWSGDLYAFVSLGDTQAILLNRAGKTSLDSSGYGDHGFQVKFDDLAVNGDIHRYRVTYEGTPPLSNSGALSGIWAPDGRTTDPDAVLDSDPRTATLSNFIGQSPNGTWTLFLADMVPGAVHFLKSWELVISAGIEMVAPQLKVRGVAGGMEVRFESQAGVMYELEGTDKLPALVWQSLGRIQGTGAEMTFGPVPATDPFQAYRVRAEIASNAPERPVLKVQNLAGGIQVIGPGKPGAIYHLQVTDRISNPEWQTLETKAGDGREINFAPRPLTFPNQFFRVLVL